MKKLGVNIDHVATLRQARKEGVPDPVFAAKICEQAGADSIVCHLREDRRHINEDDVRKLRKIVKTKLNLEISLNKEIVSIAEKIRPDYAMFVPERRQEITTEGGLDIIKNAQRIEEAVSILKKMITISFFIDPIKVQIKKSKELGAKIVELHTGSYAHAKTSTIQKHKLKELCTAAEYAKTLGLIVHAGHGLKYENVTSVANIKEIDELNIGHAIISRAVFVGLANAVKEMKSLIQ